MSKRRGWRSSERNYRAISRELQRLADSSQNGRYLRQYKDQGTPRWDALPLSEVRRKLAMVFRDVDLVLASLQAGQMVETTWAFYKWEPHPSTEGR